MINKDIADCKKKEFIENYPYSESFTTQNSNSLISVLSWNIIHKDFVDPLDFTYANETDLNWNYRLPKIIHKISSVNADIVCLQEIDKKSFGDDIGNYFSTNFNYSFCVNDVRKSKVDFSQAIMYKNNKFECKYKDYRARAIILLLTNKFEQISCIGCKNSNNICIYHSFFMVTVHLDSPRNDANNNHVRMNQIKSILKRINHCITNVLQLRIKDVNESIRILIAGDWNTGHESAVAQMLTLNNNNNFKHSFKFADTYHEAILYGNKYNHDLITNNNTLTANNPNIRIKYYPTYAAINRIFSIDLMFYTQNNIKLIGVCDTLPNIFRNIKLNWNDIMQKRINKWKQNGKQTNLAKFDNILLLPNNEFPSDHFPIAAKFEMNNLCKINTKCICCCGKNKVKNKKKNKYKKKLHQNNPKKLDFF